MDIQQGALPEVVLIDDETSVLLALTLGLRSLGCVVHPFSDPRDALEFITKAEGVEIVVTDLRMPHLNGIDLIRELRSRRQELLLFLMSGHATRSEAEAAVAAGASGFLGKPFSPDELLREIEDATTGSDHRTTANT